MVIDGVGDLLSSFARCCRPVPPEPIAGYITLGRGVSIHRADCANLLRMRDAAAAARAGRGLGPAVAGAHLPGRDRDPRFRPQGPRARRLQRAGRRAHQHHGHERRPPIRRENTAPVDLTVTVHGLDELSRLLSRFAGLPNVISARRPPN